MHLVGLVSALLEADVSQAVQLLQRHEVDAALDAPLVDLGSLGVRREGCEAQEPLCCTRFPQGRSKGDYGGAMTCVTPLPGSDALLEVT